MKQNPLDFSGIRATTRIARGIFITFIPFVSSILGIVAFGISWMHMVGSVVIVLLILSLAVNVQLIRGRNAKDQTRVVAFISPSADNQYFYTSLLMGMIKSANNVSGASYAIMPSIPKASFEEISIWTLFEEVERKAQRIDAIVFIPDDPDSHFDEIVNFVDQHPKTPLLLVDVYFDTAKMDSRTQAKLPPFVGGDEERGGILAAGLIGDLISDGSGVRGTIIVIRGGQAVWENRRVESFMKEFQSRHPDVSLIESPPLFYDRKNTMEWAVKKLGDFADSGTVRGVLGVFAADDEMALGFRDAILLLERRGFKLEPLPQVVGYDGIPEVAQLLRSGDRVIAGTVDVRIGNQAGAAMTMLHRMISERAKDERIVLVEPTPLRREKNEIQL